MIGAILKAVRQHQYHLFRNNFFTATRADMISDMATQFDFYDGGSLENALKRGQRVLYVTERCVFELTEKGLTLKEVYPGIDEARQIRRMLFN